VELHKILKVAEAFYADNEIQDIKEVTNFIRTMVEVQDRLYPKKEEKPAPSVNMMSPYHTMVHKEDLKRLMEDSKHLKSVEDILNEIRSIMGIGEGDNLVSVIKSGCYVRCALNDDGECLTCGEKFHLYTTCDNIRDIEKKIKSTVFIKKDDHQELP